MVKNDLEGLYLEEELGNIVDEINDHISKVEQIDEETRLKLRGKTLDENDYGIINKWTFVYVLISILLWFGLYKFVIFIINLYY